MKRPTYTLPSIIKKVFRPGERSLPREEITVRLEESLLAAGHERDSEDLLHEILRMEHSPIRIGRTDAIIELTYQPHQLFDMAYRFLRDTHTAKTVEQIVPELRRQTQFSWNQVERLLQLQRDPRFVQYETDKRWFLSEWKLANDELYAIAQKKGISQISARSMNYFMEQEAGLMAREYVFLPELDDRFSLEGESLQFIAQKENDQAHSHEEVGTTTDTDDNEPDLFAALQLDVWEDQYAALEDQQAAAPLFTEEQEPYSFEEETFMNTTQTPSVLTEVNQLLRQALSRLEERNQQMAQDVIGYFQQSDMQAIETLMKEKHKNEQIALGIQQVLANVERQ